MKKSLISLNNISVYNHNKNILNNISLEINQGDIKTIIGKNGAGKSTLCKVLVGSIKPNSGYITKKPNLRLSYVPQINNFNTSVPISVKRFLLLHNSLKVNLKDYQDIIETLNITTILDKQLHDLSGGEKQRVIILRSIINNPDIIVMDEPTSFIDFTSKEDIYNLVYQLNQTKNVAIILVSHDLNFVLKTTTEVVCIQNGNMGCKGHINEIDKESSFLEIFSKNWNYYKHND